MGNYVTNAQKEVLATSSSSNENVSNTKGLGPQPVFVSADAEALSHSKTTMRLTPSFDLFQMLPDDEGGQLPHAMAGNECRDSDILKVGIPDTLWDMELTDCPHTVCGGGIPSSPTTD